METFSLIDSRFDSRSSLSSLPGRTPISSANNAEEIGVRPGKDETTSSPLDDHFKSLLRPNTHLDYIQVILVRGGGGVESSWRILQRAGLINADLVLFGPMYMMACHGDPIKSGFYSSQARLIPIQGKEGLVASDDTRTNNLDL